MKTHVFPALVASVFLLVTAAPAAFAITMDGVLDPAYGPPLSTQTTQTSYLDNTLGQVGHAYGSEADGAYGLIDGGVLYLFVAGNLRYEEGAELQGIFDMLDVFIDSAPNGQSVLGTSNPAIDSGNDLNNMAGLTFDSGFGADYWVSAGSALFNVPLQAYFAELPTAGGGAGHYLGWSAPGGPGTLSFGTNPAGILVTIDDHNVAGVTAGCGAASGAGVTTGIEWAIPLSAIGNPSGCLRVCAFVSSSYHFGVSNQVLGPVPPGTCSLGAPGGVNFASIAGNQYFTICPGNTPARHTSWGSLKSIYR
jgi:hypothetical protein